MSVDDSMRRTIAEQHDEITALKAENAKLRELVRNMFFAVHPIDREKFLINVAELWIEVDG